MNPEHPNLRRNLAIAAALLLVILALAITPPLLNVSRLRHRIAASMSQSLGRPVHLDNVTVHILPLPGFTLQNLVISEDPAFGYEPVIRADTVEATLRFSSLWRRQVEISSLRFIDPSVNIVRNPAGRWNLEDILMQASRANTAPTAQRKAGPAPRFPYIEATGARVNLKLGNEKMPYSLTEADFALWLPGLQQWHIRLKGKPARTDTNASETGSVQLEGTLGRAARLADVPLNLTASWSHAQMGEATRLLTGRDAGWRGTVETGVTLIGPAGSATLTTDLTLSDLRRDDFVPAQPLDLSAHCKATTNLTSVSLTNSTCTIPDGGPQPVTVTSAALDMQRPANAPLTIAVRHMPLAWVLDWARLFTQRIPNLSPEGTLDGTLTRPSGPLTAWTGELRSTLASATVGERTLNFSEKPLLSDWRAVPSTNGSYLSLQLEPFTIKPGDAAQLTLTGSLDHEAYTLHLAGTASSPQIKAIGNAVFPPFGDELTETLKLPPTPAEVPVDIECSRPFDTHQTCTAQHAAPAPVPKPHHHRR